jgi:MFS family permease
MLKRVRGNLVYAAAMVMDLCLGGGLIAVAYVAKKDFAATPAQLGSLALASAGCYFVSSLVLGRLSDHWGRRGSVACGCVAVAAGFGLGFGASRLWHLYAVMLVCALAGGALWPALEADIADNSTARQLPARIGRFNVAWCTGFSLSGLTAGVLGQWAGYRLPLLLSALLGATAAGLYLLRRFPEQEPAGSRGSPGAEPVSARVADAYWKAALVLNFAAMGANVAMRYHVPTVTGGARGALGGLFFTLLFGSQLVSFLLLGRWHGWHYRRLPLMISVLMLGGGSLLCGLCSSTPALFGAGCVLTGAGCGLIYNSSVYYSVAAASGRGRRGGMHESAIALGAAAVPYVGGQLAMLPPARCGALLPEGVPFLTSGVFVALSALVGALLLRRARGASRRGCLASARLGAGDAPGELEDMA